MFIGTTVYKILNFRLLGIPAFPKCNKIEDRVDAIPGIKVFLEDSDSFSAKSLRIFGKSGWARHSHTEYKDSLAWYFFKGNMG